MSDTFVFYDLETSGISPKYDRIMQFASQRTDFDLNEIGEPIDVLVKLTPDILPSPYAVLVNKITPQQTIDEGYTESEFLKIFNEQVCLPGTIFVGYNNIRFDDEFIRYTSYRNYRDAYEWHYQDGRSRWDLLDVARMMRALRWDGIEWPVDSEGKPSNRLELLTSSNSINHEGAHNALADVKALVDLARLMKQSQPKLFGYLLSLRKKEKVAELVGSGKPFVYSSGRYSSEFEKTTVVSMIALPNSKNGDIVFDLRNDPSEFLSLSVDKIVGGLSYKKRHTKDRVDLPVKFFKANRCPAVAPLSVVDQRAAERIQINLEDVKINFKKVTQLRQPLEELLNKVILRLAEEQKSQSTMLVSELDVDEMLYDGFIKDADKSKMKKIVALDKNGIKNFEIEFQDERLNKLYPLYKARNFPSSLSEQEYLSWEEFRQNRLLGVSLGKSRLENYFRQIGELKNTRDLTKSDNYILEDLVLYGQSIAP